MLVGEALIREAKGLQKILDMFFEASGVAINDGKLQMIMFNTWMDLQQKLCRISHFQRGSLPSTYLAFSLITNWGRNLSWEEVLSKIRNKLYSGCFRSLTLAGQILLIKIGLQALPMYVFSALVAPQKDLLVTDHM